MADFPVIIIGGGIGGLGAAARLSHSGVSFLLFEQTNFLGGRCSTRTINGKTFEIGALYVGGGVFDHLRSTFNMEFNAVSIRGAVKIGKRFVYFPFGVRMILDLIKCGVSLHDLQAFFSHIKILKSSSTFESLKSVGDVVNQLTDNPKIRTFLYALSGVSGLSPFQISSQVLSKDSITSRYKGLNPEYLPGGNGEVASLLEKVAEKNGQIIRNVKVNKILIKEGSIIGVQTENNIYQSRFVISNAGIRKTVLELTEPNDWPAFFHSQVRDMHESLMVVNIFLTFSRRYKLPKGVTTFLMPYNMVEEFELLERGHFPEKSMFILHVPSNLQFYDNNSDHRATLQFYYPKGKVDGDSLLRHVEKIMSEGINDLFKGFSKAIIDYFVYDPFLYRQEFGFFPYVFSVAPDLHSKRLPIQTSVKNLYCVGDSVEPEGPCVPQAFESGLRCAQNILSQLESSL